MNIEELTGQVRSHVVELAELNCTLHQHVVAPFLRLRAAALSEGIDLIAQSSFRDFTRQLSIWNGKFSGARPLLDAQGSALQTESLAPADRIETILLWSALPGASRHHWGSDVDLIDRAAVPPDYRIELTAQEFSPQGPFGPLAAWLDCNAPRFGFFRPYRGVRSGVKAEPWHFSFAPVAEYARQRLSVAMLRAALEAAPLLGKDQVFERLEELHARYVACIDWP